jgi:hypothetical protein
MHQCRGGLEKYQVALGAFELKSGAKTAPVLAALANKAYLAPDKIADGRVTCQIAVSRRADDKTCENTSLTTKGRLTSSSHWVCLSYRPYRLGLES